MDHVQAEPLDLSPPDAIQRMKLDHVPNAHFLPDLAKAESVSVADPLTALSLHLGITLPIAARAAHPLQVTRRLCPRNFSPQDEQVF